MIGHVLWLQLLPATAAAGGATRFDPFAIDTAHEVPRVVSPADLDAACNAVLRCPRDFTRGTADDLAVAAAAAALTLSCAVSKGSSSQEERPLAAEGLGVAWNQVPSLDVTYLRNTAASYRGTDWSCRVPVRAGGHAQVTVGTNATAPAGKWWIVWHKPDDKGNLGTRFVYASASPGVGSDEAIATAETYVPEAGLTGGAFAGNISPGAVGVVDFVLDRAAGELRSWAIDRFGRLICQVGEGGSPLEVKVFPGPSTSEVLAPKANDAALKVRVGEVFPTTCETIASLQASTTGIGNGVLELQSSVRDDLTAVVRNVGEEWLRLELLNGSNKVRTDLAIAVSVGGAMLELALEGAPPASVLGAWARFRPPYAPTAEDDGGVRKIMLEGERLSFVERPAASATYVVSALFSIVPVWSPVATTDRKFGRPAAAASVRDEMWVVSVVSTWMRKNALPVLPWSREDELPAVTELTRFGLIVRKVKMLAESADEIFEDTIGRVTTTSNTPEEGSAEKASAWLLAFSSTFGLIEQSVDLVKSFGAMGLAPKALRPPLVTLVVRDPADPGLTIKKAVDHPFVEKLGILRAIAGWGRRVAQPLADRAWVEATSAALDVPAVIRDEIETSSASSTVLDVIEGIVGTARFAMTVANAKDADSAKKAIEAIAAPPGSFMYKRRGLKPAYGTLNAYAGVSAAAEWLVDGAKDTKDPCGFAFAPHLPVGLEVGGRMNRGSRAPWAFGAFFTIIDLGNLAAWRIDGNAATEQLPELKITHILSPGASFAFHMPNAPITLLAGAAYSPDLRKIGADGTTGGSTGPAVRAGLTVDVDVPILKF